MPTMLERFDAFHDLEKERKNFAMLKRVENNYGNEDKSQSNQWQAYGRPSMEKIIVAKANSQDKIDKLTAIING